MLGYVTRESDYEGVAAVPDFFQEESPEALRLQIDWLMDQLGVDESFFANLTGAEKNTFSRWRREFWDLPEAEVTLRVLWRTVLHLLSFLSFDSRQLAKLFQSVASAHESPAAPPWRGVTLQQYLEQGGREAVTQVESWVTGLRFDDPVAT